MKTLDEIKSILREHKQELRQKYGVKETGLFGSYVRGEQKVTSDIDIVADFEEPISLLELVRVEIYLSEILNAKVDLIPREDIREELKESILAETVKV
jgi:predicted nucleotidyltransferase